MKEKPSLAYLACVAAAALPHPDLQVADVNPSPCPNFGDFAPLQLLVSASW